MCSARPLTIVGEVRERPVCPRRGHGKTVCARSAWCALLGGPSTSPLEARMVSAVSQLRIVAIWYALLGALSSIGAFAAFSLFRHGAYALYGALSWPTDTSTLPNPATKSLLIWGSTAVLSWVSFVLSLRYLPLSPRGQLAALVVSLLLALGCILEAANATFSDVSQVVWGVWWGIAGACSLCSLLLWRHRRASNNRVWTPPSSPDR